MNKTFPLSLLGLTALLTSSTEIFGQAPKMTLLQNDDQITANFAGDNFEGKIDITTDKTLGATNFKVVVADERIAEMLEDELSEFGFKIPTDFGLGSTIEFGLSDDIISSGINIDTVRHDAPELADGIDEITALAKADGEGETDHFDSFMVAMGYAKDNLGGTDDATFEGDDAHLADVATSNLQMAADAKTGKGQMGDDDADTDKKVTQAA